MLGCVYWLLLLTKVFPSTSTPCLFIVMPPTYCVWCVNVGVCCVCCCLHGLSGGPPPSPPPPNTHTHTTHACSLAMFACCCPASLTVYGVCWACCCWLTGASQVAHPRQACLALLAWAHPQAWATPHMASDPLAWADRHQGCQVRTAWSVLCGVPFSCENIHL
jgi:hypothetical protein